MINAPQAKKGPHFSEDDRTLYGSISHLDGLWPGRGRGLNPVLVEGRHDVAVLPALLAGQEDQPVVAVAHRRVLNL